MYVKLSYEKKLREMYENIMRSSLSVTLISAHYTKIMSKSGLKWGIVYNIFYCISECITEYIM